jgi:hypothetical protein
MSGSSSSSPAAERGAFDQPLGLTVHSLPVPQDAALADEVRTKHGRWKMLAVMLVCAAPVIASYFTYYVVRAGRAPQLRRVDRSAAALAAVTATTLDGKPVPLPSLQGQWLLVSVGSGACDSRCEQHLVPAAPVA